MTIKNRLSSLCGWPHGAGFNFDKQNEEGPNGISVNGAILRNIMETAYVNVEGIKFVFGV